MDIWVEEIEGWSSRPFSGGYAGLHELADSSFSGAVSAGSTWLLFVNGRVVSVVEFRQTAAGPEFDDGDIERFEDGQGTVYEAPHPSVPLLVAMQLGDGETRGRYYTEKTPLANVHETLSEGGFTGYIELSENVLSGDYYAVYQSGRSMDLAFVGNARRLKTEDDAKDAARDEVGIYEVVAVDIDVTAIPEPEEEATGAAGAVGAAGATGAAAGGAAMDDPTEAAEETEDAAAPEPVDDAGADRTEAAEQEDTGYSDPEPVEEAEPEPAVAAAEEEPEEEATEGEPEAEAAEETGDESEETDTEPEPEPEPETDAEPEVGDETDTEDGDAEPEAVEATDAPPEPSDDEPVAADPEPVGGVASAAPDEELPDGEERTGRNRETAAAASDVSNAPASPPETEAGGGVSHTEQLASRSIPSLDPERTAEDGGTTPVSGSRRDRPGERRGREGASRRRTREESAETASSEGGADPEELASVRESLEAAESERDEARAEVSELESELASAREERDELETELESVRSERDELESEAEELRERVAELESQLGTTGGGVSLSEAEALAGTNLFVRYESKGKTTVEDAHDGHGSSEDLTANLRITSHTQFEAEGATVAGQPFEEWLHGSQPYRFAAWLVERLVFEIRDTGSADRMRDLYDALPRIDRIEFDGAITAADGEETREAGFDVVFRDRMGEPLFAADLDASREPVGETEMATLVQEAVGVCRAAESFAGAFYVTAAFFESEALDTARDATSGSLLSRDSRLSYVKDSRKRGFHLGLVESRDGAFHLSVPDL